MKRIHIEVVYASKTKQHLIKLSVNEGSTIETAIEQSGILTLYPEINLAKHKVGIFSKVKALSDEIKEGDRIEIYRPLLIDPMEARRAKAKMNARRKN